MAVIGTFKRVGDQYQGQIITLSVQSRDVVLRPSDSSSDELVVIVAGVEVGLAKPTDAEPRSTWTVTLDDPSFSAPIVAELRAGAGGDALDLVWQRGPA